MAAGLFDRLYKGIGFFLFCFLLNGEYVRAAHHTPHHDRKIGIPMSQQAIPYRAVLSGVGNFTIRELIEKHADIFSLQHKPPLTIAELKKRASHDMPSVIKALNILGYYNAQVDFSLDLSTNPITVNFMVHLGPKYTITKFDVKSTEPNNLAVKNISMNLERIGVGVGQAANMKDIRHAIKKAFVLLGNTGYPYAKIKHEKAVIDHTAKGLEITLEIDPGDLMHFGDVHIHAEPHIDQKFIKSRLKWKEGEVYSNVKVMQTVEVLNNTGLYSYVKINRPPTPPSDGKVNMFIEVISGEPREFSWNFKHDGSGGFNGNVAWKGTNVFGEGDFVKVEGAIGEFRTGLFFEHLSPDFIWPESEFVTRADLNRTHWTAYRQFNMAFSQTLTTPIIDKLKANFGYKFSINNIAPHGDGTLHNPVLLSLPLGVSYEDFDNPRAPHKGWSVKLDLFPYLDIAPSRFFFQSSLQNQVYYPLTDDKRLVLSGWFTMGVSPGAGKNVLPMNRKFYAGGFETVRGYGLQMAGELDSKGKPVGGRSMFALGSQLRYYFTDALSGVGFIDVGRSFKSRFPNLAKKMFVSMGAGFRYASDIGELYLDLAVPTNRRHGDRKAQIYFGVGQPF